MTIEVAKTGLPALQSALGNPNVKKKFEEMLGKRAPQFISSIITVAQGNASLLACTSDSIIGSAAIAAQLDLSIHPSLGQAAIVPYKSGGRSLGSFQIMWKGIVQLAQRSGQYKTINVTEVYKGQLVKEDPFTGEFEFKLERESDEVVGYVAYIKLLNGFEKYWYWTAERVREHAEKYSKSFQYDLKDKKKDSKWSTDFDEMAKKTVLKLLIDKFGPKSIEMQQAIINDQGVTEDYQAEVYDNPQYPDNPQSDTEVKVMDGDGNEIVIKDKKVETAANMEKEFEKKAEPKHKVPSFIKIKGASEPDNTEEEIESLKEKFKTIGCGSYKQITEVIKFANPKEAIPTAEEFFATVDESFLETFKEAFQGYNAKSTTKQG